MKLVKLLNEIQLSELKTINAFHGSTQNFDTFDLNRVGNGHDQNGPGFYFTTSESEAEAYGEYVHQYELKLRKLLPTRGKINQMNIINLIKSAPNYKETLQNWGENINIALRDAVATFMDQESPFHAFTSVWYDFYLKNSKEYLENVVKLGYDAVIVSGESGYGNIQSREHIVVFNPNAIKKINKS